MWTILAADLISALTVYFDSYLTSRGQHLYSLPPNVEVGCDNGKNYHFWIPAYTSRYLFKAGYGSDASMAASFNLEVGYQMISKSYQRKPYVSIQQPFDSLMNDKNRIDLAYGSAGAKFGVESAQKNRAQISIDEDYEALYAGSGRLNLPDDTPKSDQEYIVRWIKLMWPRSALYH